ncbi:DUF6519 domain-containing protein [Streptomyces sp. NPDC004980]
MAQISQDTFDPMRRFVRVRLQQGVPIVDADVNEREDIQKFELRAFLKWFVGDGVPEGNDGFRITGTGDAYDFTIQCGVTGAVDPLSRIGRYLVQGLDVMIEKDYQYTEQKLHEDHGPSATQLAARWNVPVVKALGSLDGSPAILIYLDVWERLVTPTDDPSLIYGGLGTESCARHKREWAVRAKAGTDLPQAEDPPGGDFRTGHAYTALATIERQSGHPPVQPQDITDLRQRQLLLPPASLIQDVLGLDPMEYRRGAGRPSINLRAAINALLREVLPSGLEGTIAAASFPIGRSFVIDQDGPVAFWTNPPFGADPNKVFAARLSLSAPESGFSTPPLQITSSGDHREPHAVSLPSGDLLLVYQKGFGSGADIELKHGKLTDLATTQPVTVTTTSVEGETRPFVVVAGQVATVFMYLPAAKRWKYRSYQLTDKTWLHNAPINLPLTVQQGTEFHAAADVAGNIWVAVDTIETGPHARVLKIDMAAGTSTTVLTTTDTFKRPFLLSTRGGDVWVFWAFDGCLHTQRFRAAAASWDDSQIIVPDNTNCDSPCAVEDADGGISLFLTMKSSTHHENRENLAAIRSDPVSGAWGGLRELSTSPESHNMTPIAVVGPDDATWLFWARDRDEYVDIQYKRLITAV